MYFSSILTHRQTLISVSCWSPQLENVISNDHFRWRNFASSLWQDWRHTIINLASLILGSSHRVLQTHQLPLALGVAYFLLIFLTMRLPFIPIFKLIIIFPHFLFLAIANWSHGLLFWMLYYNNSHFDFLNTEVLPLGPLSTEVTQKIR